MKSRIIPLVDDIIILEVKTNDSFEYYIRSEYNPFKHVFSVYNKFSKADLVQMLQNGYFDIWLEEH